LDVLGEDYVRTARAKGLGESTVVLKHALRNALVPIVTVLGLTIALMIGGAVITETVFAIPGAGRLMIDSIYGRDYPVVQGLTLAMAVLVSLVFLATDLVQAALDPRVKA
jgi:peptide/nickel transport system permease protein